MNAAFYHIPFRGNSLAARDVHASSSLTYPPGKEEPLLLKLSFQSEKLTERNMEKPDRDDIRASCM